MTTVTPLRRDDGPLVLPAAIVAGATMHTDDAKHATPVHNASTGCRPMPLIPSAHVRVGAAAP